MVKSLEKSLRKQVLPALSTSSPPAALLTSVAAHPLLQVINPRKLMKLGLREAAAFYVKKEDVNEFKRGQAGPQRPPPPFSLPKTHAYDTDPSH